MSAELLYGVNEVIIAAAMLVLLVVANEYGYRKGVKARETFNDGARSHIGTISGGALGVLALLLGFSFAMSLSRFDLRNHLVVEEANAIGTTYLRSRLLPAPINKEVAALLRQYVDVRVDFYRLARDQAQFNQVNDRTEELQRELWARVPLAVQKDPGPVTTGLFMQSLNEVIDLSEARRAARDNHVPEGVVVLLFSVALMATLGIGYGCGLGQHRNLFSTIMLAVLLVLVITVIIDLDRPARGLIRVRQDSMLRLQNSLVKDVF